MANTYTQIHIHIIFAVKFRQAVIMPVWKDTLHKYITGVVQNNSHKMVSINSMPDHIHMLIGLRPIQALSDLIRMVKGDSSEWINQQRLTKAPFRWQNGFGAFSYAISQVPTVCGYIENQELYHRKKTFEAEYHEMLQKFQVEHDERYTFKTLQ